MSETVKPAPEPKDFALRVMQTIARANLSAANGQAVGYDVGFTERDVNNLHAIVEGWPIERPEEMHAALRSLADRISALLPPEEE